jgi:hypothetical protein
VVRKVSHTARDAPANRVIAWRGGIEDRGARGLDRSLGTLLDGVAMRGSLRNCVEALRLEDVLDTHGLVLFSLDVADYPHATRKVASWILLGMGRLARQFPDRQPERIAGLGSVIQVQRVSPAGAPRALLLVDEVGALGHSARHLRGLVGRARETGLAVVLATQGPSDLEAVDRALLPQAAAGHGVATRVPPGQPAGRRAHAGAVRTRVRRGPDALQRRSIQHTTR